MSPGRCWSSVAATSAAAEHGVPAASICAARSRTAASRLSYGLAGRAHTRAPDQAVEWTGKAAGGTLGSLGATKLAIGLCATATAVGGTALCLNTLLPNPSSSTHHHAKARKQPTPARAVKPTPTQRASTTTKPAVYHRTTAVTPTRKTNATGPGGPAPASSGTDLNPGAGPSGPPGNVPRQPAPAAPGTDLNP